MSKNFKRTSKTSNTALALGLCMAAHAFSATDLGTYKGCAADDSQFEKTQIYDGPHPGGPFASNDVKGPTKVAFVHNPTGNADVYFILKSGTVSRYNAISKTTDELGTIPVDEYEEQGLVGIAIRKDFAANPWVYFMYSSNETGGKFGFRISRIKLKTDLKSLDLTSEKVLITIPREKETWHTAGAMQFDDYNDLWVAIGDNMKTTAGPGNTADLRGSILRIHPDESAKGYTIPAGNFSEKMAAYFKTKGNATLADQYSNPTMVKPEIYVKGSRNAYTISVDPVRRWLAWGDVGPDQGQISEEYNLLKEPAFTGWPFFAGSQDMSVDVDGKGPPKPYGVQIPGGSTREVPVNNESNNTGVKTLPPNHEPIYKRKTACAMTGPIFRYDGSIKNPGQFPPQFDRKWMIGGCDNGFGLHLLSLNTAGDSVSKDITVLGSVAQPDNLVDLKLGPDGSLYYVNWGNQNASGIWRIDYKGTCKDATLLPETVSNKPFSKTEFQNAHWMKMGGGFIEITAPGKHHILITDVKGKIVWETFGEGSKSHSLPKLAQPAVYQVKAETSWGVGVSSLSNLGL